MADAVIACFGWFAFRSPDSGVTRSTTGLASGLVETMREIAGAIGVAAVSTVLVSQAGAAGPSARALETPNVFHAAYWVIVVVAALGALTAAIAFPWRATRETEPVRYRPATSRR